MMALLDNLRQRWKQDRATRLFRALLSLQALLLLGWGATTLIGLLPERRPPATPPPKPPAPRDLSFLMQPEPGKFALGGNNPFSAPYMPLPSQGGAVQRPGGSGARPPSRPTTAAQPAAANVAAAVRPKNIELVYKGTMTANDGALLALVEEQGSGSSHFVRIGDTVEGGSVTGFGADTLVLERGGNRLELRLGEPRVVGQR